MHSGPFIPGPLLPCRKPAADCRLSLENPLPRPWSPPGSQGETRLMTGIIHSSTGKPSLSSPPRTNVPVTETFSPSTNIVEELLFISSYPTSNASSMLTHSSVPLVTPNSEKHRGKAVKHCRRGGCLNQLWYRQTPNCIRS